MVAGKDEKPRLLVSNGPNTVRVLRAAIGKGLLPDTYVTDGQLVHVERVSGRTFGTGAADQDSPLPVAQSVSTPDLLASWLIDHAYVYEQKKVSGALADVEVLPPVSVLKTVLATQHWPGLSPLKGIIGAPILRPDGTLFQADGYDQATGYLLEKKVLIDEVPQKPTVDEVAAARAFIVDELLGEFFWKDKSDKANFIAALVSQILRPYLKSLVPLVIVTATTPGSGKTILTSLLGMLYGQKFLPWPYSEEEMSKTLITAMCTSVGVVIFDNLQEGTAIESAMLAGALTSEEYSGRKLGSSQLLTARNDKIWIATGNNLQTGGDIGSRAIVVRLAPDGPNPEERSGFTIPNLPEQALDPRFQGKVLWNLLVLVADWVNAGTPTPRDQPLPMRQFTPWLQKVGGFLAHHGITDFMGNREETRAINESDEIWFTFESTMFELYGNKRFKVDELRRTAQPTFEPFPYGARQDPNDDGDWHGAFLKSPGGRVLTKEALGKMLKGRVDRFHGDYRLRSEQDSRNKTWWYWVEKIENPSSDARRPENLP